MNLPEALHLVADGQSLAICDAQLLPHVTFTVACGDSCEWSRNIVVATCKALDVTAAWSDGEELSIEGTIEYWHAELGAEDGFLP